MAAGVPSRCDKLTALDAYGGGGGSGVAAGVT